MKLHTHNCHRSLGRSAARFARTSGLGSALFLLAACGSDGAQGPQGQQGPAGAASNPSSTSVVSPPQGLLDRQLVVQIGGSGTSWTDADKPDFGGTDIQLVESHAASPTLMVATIKIAKDAKLGRRDVKVGSAVATQAFTVTPAIDVKSSDAMKTVSVDQGGLVQFDITNNDTKAFDSNAFKLQVPGIVDLGTQASSAFAATGFILAAPLAPAGSEQIMVANLGADGSPKLSWYSDPQALAVKARAASPLALGTATTQTFAGDGVTKLYKASSASGVSILDFRMEVPDKNATVVPYLLVFNANAKSADDQLGLVGPPSFFGQLIPPPWDLHVTLPQLSGGSDVYAVVLDLSKKSGTSLKLTPSSIAATKIAESATAHGTAAPQAIGTLPATDGFVVDAKLDAGDVDVYKVTAAAGDKVQIAVSGVPDVDVQLAKVAVVADPQTEVLDEVFGGAKASASSTVTLATMPAPQTDLYVIVRADSQGKTATGSYALSARKVP